MPEALPAVTVPVLEKAGAQLTQRLGRDARLGELVGIDHHVALAALDGDRNDLVLELAFLHGRFGLVLRSGGELVLLLAGDLPLLGHVLGGRAHVVALEGIHQAVAEHGVDQLRVAHLDAVAQMHDVGRLAHAFLAAGDDDVGIAHLDRLEAQRHRAQAGTAKLIDAIGGLLDGNAGVDGGLTGGVLPGAGGQHLTQHDFGHFTRLDARALQRFPDRDFAQVMGGYRAQRAVERTDGRACGAGNNDFGHGERSLADGGSYYGLP